MWLLGTIESGVWTLARWATCDCKELSRRIRVNGQHSSAALVKAAASGMFPSGTQAVIERYECDTEEDLAEVFDLFDNPMSARTTSDKFAFYAGTHDDLAGLDPVLLGTICNGVARYKTSRKIDLKAKKAEVDQIPLTFPAREKGQYLNEPKVREFLRWAYGLSATKLPKALRETEITQCMFNDFSVDEKFARLFWERVFASSHDDPDHPTRQLYATLVELLAKDRRSRGRGKFVNVCSKMYRIFIKYEQLQQLAA
jgi:hypothetical protein